MLRTELKPGDAIVGKEGQAFAIIGSKRINLFTAKKIKVTAEKEKAELKTIGRRTTGNKTKGVKLKVEMTIYEPEDIFDDIMLDYINAGKDLYFEILIENEDPTSEAGMKQMLVTGVNLDSTTLAELDADKDFLEKDVSATAEGIQRLQKFNRLSYAD